ncbi:MAG TPA: tripartite tricarboxylate transporter substrate binding protein, partial [Roseomonas sp.]
MTLVQMPRRALLTGAATASFLSWGAFPARAAWAPQQPIRVLVGYPPGGAVDILVRLVGEGVQRLRGVSV